QQQAAFQDSTGDRGVAHRTEQNRVLLAELGQNRLRQELPSRMPASGSQVVSSDLGIRDNLTEDLQGLGNHLRPDPVTGDHSEPHLHTSREPPRPAGLELLGQRLPAAVLPPAQWTHQSAELSRYAGHTDGLSTARTCYENGPSHHMGRPVPERDRHSKLPVRTIRAPTAAPIGSSTPASTGRSTRSIMMASERSVVWLTIAASMFTPTSPSSVPTLPITPGRSGYSSSTTVPSARRSKCRPLTSTSFSTWSAPDSAPETTALRPSGSVAFTDTTLRWLGLSGVDCTSTWTPSSSASCGALTNVTWLSTAPENTPRSAASCSTEMSSSASSPRASTVTEFGVPASSAANSWPSFCASGRYGRTSSPTAPPCTFTASGTKSPRSANLTDLATSVPARFWASAVEAPRCGVTTTLSSSNSGLDVVGSVLKTSMPAPPTWPLRSASTKASSSISPPRAALTMITPGLVFFSSSAPIRPSVSAVFGR